MGHFLSKIVKFELQFGKNLNIGTTHQYLDINITIIGFEPLVLIDFFTITQFDLNKILMKRA